MALQHFLSDARERWGVEGTPFFMGVMGLVAIAILLGTLAHVSVLTAGAADFNKRADFYVWSTSATALALGALVVAVLIRFDAKGSPAPAYSQSIDFRVGVGLAVLTVLFALIGVIVGMGGHPDSAGTWERYATMFSFVTATWFVLSQPVPETIGTTKATTIGLIIAAVALPMLVIGQIMGLGNSTGSYVGGVSWQAMAISIIVIDLGWFLGMQRR